jgi:hypothetical protein
VKLETIRVGARFYVSPAAVDRFRKALESQNGGSDETPLTSEVSDTVEG